MENSVQFISAEEGDVPEIIALRQKIWSTTYRGVYPDSMIDDFDFAWHREKELLRVRSPAYFVYLIVRDGQRIGYLTMRKNDAFTLQSLYILAEYQRRGIGKMAFDFIRQFCREQGAEAFICHCVPENMAARAFYRKMGGVQVGEDLDNEEGWMNSVIYRFEVDS